MSTYIQDITPSRKRRRSRTCSISEGGNSQQTAPCSSSTTANSSDSHASQSTAATSFGHISSSEEAAGDRDTNSVTLTKTARNQLYEPLPSPSSIRLLRLLPAASQRDSLRAELLIVELDQRWPFEALSYTWGEAFHGQDPRSDAIKLGECLIEITGNLGHALRRLRYRGQARCLWVDALCIDQAHDRERGYQIEIMEHIYSHADRVLAWTGEDSDAKDGDYIYTFCKIVERSSRPPQRAVAAFQRQHHNYKALSSLFANRRYFRRRWIIQELCHAKEVRVMCGGSSVSLATFSACVHKVPASRRGMEKLKELCSLIEQIREALSDWRLQQQYPDHPRLSRLKVSRSPILTDFLWMLQRFHTFDCTKAEDRLHAIASLWKSEHASEVFSISSDYTLCCDKLYTDFAHRFIRAHSPKSQVISQLLSIAADQARGDTRSDQDSLPSWVVDWRLQPALNISLSQVYADIDLQQCESSKPSELILRTRCFGTAVEAHGHYRDWTLLTADGLMMPCSEGSLSDDKYVTSLSQLCTKLEPGDMLCHPYAQYRGRLGHVADAAIVLRPCKALRDKMIIVGRCPLDLWWSEAAGIGRKTASIPSTAITVCIV